MNKGGNIMKRTVTPILRWMAIIAGCSFVLYMMRKFAQRRVPERTQFTLAFIDSLAIFLGKVLRKININRPERVFLVYFSIIGLVFKTIYTGNLFVLFQMRSDDRITTLNQLARQNIILYTDFASSYLEICVGAPL